MSVEVNPGAQVPEFEFVKYLTASLVKDAYFQISPRTGALVRRDFSAAAVAYIVPLGDLSLEKLEETLSQFLVNASGNPNKQAVTYTFLFVSEDWAAKQDYISVIEAKQEEMDRAAILSDFVMVDCTACTYTIAGARRMGDKKLSKVLTYVLAIWCHSPEDRERAKQEIAQALNARKQALTPKIQRKGPNPIFMLLFANILIFIGGLILEARTGTDWFVKWGIQDNHLILSGQVWRLLTSMFLHADFAHLGGNMLFLYMLGRSLYPYYSNGTLWGMYLISGLVGNVAGLLFTDYLSLGASGAIMGLGGVLVYRMFKGEHAKVFRHRGNFVSLAAMIAYNLFYGLFVPGIDNYGHFGGFLGGFLVAAVLAWWAGRKK